MQVFDLKVKRGSMAGQRLALVDGKFHELVTLPYRPVPEVNQHVRRSAIAYINTGGDAPWFGGLRSLEAAHELLTEGWKSGTERAMKLADQLADKLPTPTSIRRRPQWVEDGDEISVDRLYQGQIDSMWRVAKRKYSVNQQVLSIASHFGANCNTGQEEMFWQGASMIALASILEDAGYQTELSGIWGSSYWGSSRSSICRVVLKDAGETLRIDNVAAVIAHAGVFRSYGFFMQDEVPWQVPDSRGHWMDSTVGMQALADAGLVEPVDIFLPAQNYNESSARKALEDAIQALESRNSLVGSAATD